MASQANDNPLLALLALAEAADGPVVQPSCRIGPPLGADVPVQLNLAEQLAFAHTHSQHGSDWQLLSSRLPRHAPQALARAWQAAACDRGASGNGLLARYAVALQQGLTPAASFVACVSSLPHHAQPQPSGAAQQAVQQRGGCGTSGREASQQTAAPAGSSGRSGSPAMQQAGTTRSSSSEGAALAAILQSHLHGRGQAAMAPPPQRPVQQPQQHWQGSPAQPRAARPPVPHSAGSPAARKAKHESAVCSALAQLAQHMADPEKLARVFSHLQGTVSAALRSRQGSNPAADAAAALARSAAATASAAGNEPPGRGTPPAMAATAAAAATAGGGAMPRLPPEVHHMPPQLLQQWVQQQQRKVERLHAQLQQEQALQPPASQQQQQQPARALPAAAPSSELVRPQIVPSQLGGSAHAIDVRSLAATREGAAALHALKCLKLLPPQLPDGAQLALQLLLPRSFQESHRTLGQPQHSQQQTQQQQQALVAALAGAQQAGEQQQEGQPVVNSPASSMDDDMNEWEAEEDRQSSQEPSTSQPAADEVAQPAGVASDVTAAAAETIAPQQPAAAEADPDGTMLKQRPPSTVVVVHAHADGLDSLDSDDAAAAAFEAAVCYSTGDKRPACVAMQHALTGPYGSDGAAAPPAAKRAAVSAHEGA